MRSNSTRSTRAYAVGAGRQVSARAARSNSAADGGAPLSYFEVVTALAFAAFADAPVDVAVVEVGLGGGWDATNVADGAVAVVAPVGLDHRDLETTGA